MRRFVALFALALLPQLSAAQSVFINEIHYDNTGGDVGEFFEIAGPPGQDLTGWTVVLYNGNGGAPYGSTVNLAGTLPTSCVGLGVQATTFPANGLQNGAPDGLALIDDMGMVVQFLSYEGSFTAVGGPADGMMSIDIGVLEPGGDPIGNSLQLTGTGNAYGDFTWTGPVAETPNACNSGQMGLPPPPPFINEIHYDNTGGDVGEFFEIAGLPGTDLTGWTVVLYNGNGGAPYGSTVNLAGTLPTSCPGLGVQVTSFPANGLQNGAPDGLALIDDMGMVVQFLSYEGSFTAVGGPADGLMSTDIGVLEPGGDPIGNSLQLTGTGSAYADFTWTGPIPETPGACNTGQMGGAGGGVTLNIDDVSMAEGNAGGTTFNFTVSLTAPAAGDVSFDFATMDGSAAGLGVDYTSSSGVGQVITMGSTSVMIPINVIGDTTVEPDENFFVNITNVVGATAGDVQGEGTILNDDFVITPIHDIQGNGAVSPLNGNMVVTRGIVTGLKSNGFFIQEPDASIDADPLTSEGIFVFTPGGAMVAVGDDVQVQGTVTEFTPGSDPFQPPLTELGFATTLVLSSGNPLPMPIALTTTFPDPAGTFDQLERLEGMRVSVASMTVNSGTEGFVNETNATGGNNGVFFGVVTGVARSIREAGIEPPDPAPAGTIPPIPRWDGNPELLRVDSDGLVGQPQLTVTIGQTVSNLVGPLDYGFRRYTLLPDPGSTAAIAGPNTSIPVSAPLPTEFTVASFNVQRLFDDIDDPMTSEPVLTSVAYANRLSKASIAIRNELQMPDIIGFEEVENLGVLQDLSTQISTDAAAATQPDPMYAAYLVEGNDFGGIDVGFLVKTAMVATAQPRVTVNAVVQELAGSLFTNPDMSTVLLNDRPPLRLDAVINNDTGQSYPVTVIVNHLRSLSNATSTDPEPGGWTNEGERVRAKRQAQAVDLANLIQTRQTNNPNENIVVVGDFNAFEFNDGLGDSMNTIAGTPTPDDQTAVLGDGADLVNPDLDNLFDTAPADERYSFTFGGVGQSLDHALVNAGLIASSSAPRIEHARFNAGFPETDRDDPMTARRLSDHDPLVVYISPNGFQPIDLSITKVANDDPVVAGAQTSYTITVANAGPQPALNAAWTDTLPAGTTFVSLNAVAGWTCTTPAVGAGGMVDCSNPSFGIGSDVFTLTVLVDSSIAAGSMISNNVTASTASPDSNPMNNSDTATFTVSVESDISITLTDTPDPVTAGTNMSYTATVTNGGLSDATDVGFSLPLAAGTSFVSVTPSAGGVCNAASPVVCTWAGITAPAGSHSATIVVLVDPATVGVISATATASSVSTDPNAANDTATAMTAVGTAADLSLVKTVTAPSPLLLGDNITYTLAAANAGPSDATDAVVFDNLPANLTYVSNTCGASFAAPTVTWNIGSLVAGGSASCDIVATVTDVGAIDNSATISSSAADSTPNNNTGTVSLIGAFLADLSISISSSAPSNLGVGQQYSYVVTGTNAGPTLADNVVFTLVLSGKISFVSSDCGAVLAGDTLTWSVATLAAGASTSCTINVAVVAPGDIIVDGTIASTTPDPNLVNNSTQIVVGFIAVAVPALGQFGLLLTLLLLAGAGVVVIRRQG
ncbi:MAG: DUF11 domain-containing protein [Xanthomonadales bacterium]|nr:DUF11 domain-containing protein [Xanthomonadales bacterium]